MAVSDGGEIAAESGSNPDSTAAQERITTQKVARADYTPVKVK